MPRPWSPVDGVLYAAMYVGVKSVKRSRETGAIVGIYDETISPEVGDCGSDRWGIVCETHATVLCDPTLAGAKASQSYPSNFCPDCQDLVECGKKLTAREAVSDRVAAMLRPVHALRQYETFRKVGATRTARALKR